MLPFVQKDGKFSGKKRTSLDTDNSLNPIRPVLWNSMLVCGCFIYGSYSVLIHLSETSDGKIAFSSSSLVLAIEGTKLLVSVAFSLLQLQKHKVLNMLTFEGCLSFFIPAFLYCVNNNLSVHMQTEMDPATFQVLCNLKIISTAILYKLIIKKPITTMQRFSLLLLTTAGICNSYGGLKTKPQYSKDIYITWFGLLLMILYCIISGLAGVYSEYILKKQRQLPLSVQNTILYTYGVLCNGFVYVTTAHDVDELFSGFSLMTWIIVLTQVASGFIMSAIIKHSGNITRLFYISCAMVVTTFLSITLLSIRLNGYFISSCSLVILAIVLYHRN